MQYNELEKLGERVSRLGFGCMRFPTTPEGGIDEPRAEAMLDSARASITLIRHISIISIPARRLSGA